MDIPNNVEDYILEGIWDFLEEVWGIEIRYPDDTIPEHLRNILQSNSERNSATKTS